MATEEDVRESPQGNIMTVGDLADFLRLHPSLHLRPSGIYRLLRQGALPSFKVGSNWCFRREIVDRWGLSQLQTAQ